MTKSARHVVIGVAVIVFYAMIPAHAQQRVILDTDIDSDVDDVEALAMLHQLADQNTINFLGVIVTSEDPFAPTCVSAINTFFQRPKLPVGFLKSQKKLIHQPRYKYTQQISEEFPHPLKSHENAPDGVLLYRKLLSQSPDSSVTIVTIGHLSTIQGLLQSKPDRISKLDGVSLVRKKVKHWYCMGGIFPSGKEANFYFPDPASTVYCLTNWPGRVTFAGWEVGKKITTGGLYLKNRVAPDSPVYRAYELYNDFEGRPSWDQVAVLLLMDSWPRYFDIVSHGYCHVNTDGSNEWRTDKDHPYHQYLALKPETDPDRIGQMIDDMVIR